MNIKSMIQIVTLWVAICIFPSNILCQKQDHIWTLGQKYKPVNFDFNQDPVRIFRHPSRDIDFFVTIGSYCHEDGSLFSYSNGKHIYAADDSIMEGGDSTLYGLFWEMFKGIGLKVQNCMLYLPDPGDKNQVYFFNQFINYDGGLDIKPCSFHYSLIDVSANNGLGRVIKKDVMIIDTLLNTNHVQAVRHGNGRDWWLTVIGKNHESIYTLLLDPSGVKFTHKMNIDHFGLEGRGFGESCFSPDGSKYAVVTTVASSGDFKPAYLYVLDFDRVTGQFSNQRLAVTQASTQLVFSRNGVAFSPNSKYVYSGNGFSMYQFEVKPDKLSRIFLANSDDFLGEYEQPHQFVFWTLAPDGRIYGTSGVNGTIHMNVINFPDERTYNCKLVEHGVTLPTHINGGMPNFPNYRLGPLDGSACDTLGLDNHPIAKFRYEDDTIIDRRIRFTDLSYFRPETWSWDFGDNSPKISQRSPYHTYAQNGTYKVCLTVSNENSSNTSCRNITIGPTATSDDNVIEDVADVTLFPNPVQDNLLITIGEYIPERGYIEIYNLSGQQIHKQRAYYGHNNVDMTQMTAGTYILRIVDGGVLVREEKVVKM
jgi:hypothetical protein